MRKFWPALAVAMMVAGLGFAADDAGKTPASAVPPTAAPAPANVRPDEIAPSQLPAIIKQNAAMVAQWEQRLGMLRTEEAKKAFADAIKLEKAFLAGLEQLSDAYRAGKEDDARRLSAQLRDKRPELVEYASILPIWLEIDQAKTAQAERGQANPDLNARLQQFIDLLTRRLDLQNQVNVVNKEIVKERLALQKAAAESAPVKAPAADSPATEPKPEPMLDPKSKAKPGDPS